VLQREALSPYQLLHWLAQHPAKQEVCIECGAGLGELASFFRPFFKTVVATDIAPQRLKSPFGVKVVRAAAEHLPTSDASVDLLISMQALHHFDIEAHLVEATRVLRPGGVFAALSWGEMILPEPIQRAFRPTFAALAAHWEDARASVVSGYADLVLAGKPLALPQARMTRQITFPDLQAEIERWSAFRRARAFGADMPDPVLMGLDPTRPFEVHWPLLGRACQV
jgi:ubiquinone/menaquinone biosynthesis C-methylase UbiE